MALRGDGAPARSSRLAIEGRNKDIVSLFCPLRSDGTLACLLWEFKLVETLLI